MGADVVEPRDATDDRNENESTNDPAHDREHDTCLTGDAKESLRGTKERPRLSSSGAEEAFAVLSV